MLETKHMDRTEQLHSYKAFLVDLLASKSYADNVTNEVTKS